MNRTNFEIIFYTLVEFKIIYIWDFCYEYFEIYKC
jgi:hypothetical protein